ncbi:hypothetical protein DPMN_160604 [Dreissena polymorpha]|uniref:Uncharacterized protein n=1 Tax=Dreissena polymorpha TaxID=45954 RepID=A0A9D4ERE9_DREPO|nr:hypothetical protein DPMN_160604 [Dreissena polymorpha]
MSIGLFSRAVWSGTTLTATYGFISGQKDVDAQAGHEQRRQQITLVPFSHDAGHMFR